jgi:hypothetical protein
MLQWATGSLVGESKLGDELLIGLKTANYCTSGTFILDFRSERQSSS